MPHVRAERHLRAAGNDAPWIRPPRARVCPPKPTDRSGALPGHPLRARQARGIVNVGRAAIKHGIELGMNERSISGLRRAHYRRTRRRCRSFRGRPSGYPSSRRWGSAGVVASTSRRLSRPSSAPRIRLAGFPVPQPVGHHGVEDAVKDLVGAMEATVLGVDEALARMRYARSRLSGAMGLM